MSVFDPAALLQSILWIRPELLLTLVSFVLLGLAVALPPELRRSAGWVAVFGFVLAGCLVAAYLPGTPLEGPKIGDPDSPVAFPDAEGRPALLVDGFAVVFKLIFLAGATLCVLMALRFLDLPTAKAGEFYAVVVLAVIGMMLMASGNEFATIYIGLETMALSSYVLVGLTTTSRKTNEAALKYFLLGAFASAIFVYGISLVYGATGSIHLQGIADAISAEAQPSRPLLGIGAVLILVGMAFKVAAVPFHMWTPDAYEGAPTPVTAFISTAAKAAAFAMLLRVFLKAFLGLAADWTPLLAVLSVGSMTLGNFVAIRQDNVKRMLAYSSIAHAGYMLLGLIAVGAARGDAFTERYGMTAVALYALVYTFTNMGAFGLVVLLRRQDVVGDTVDDFRGLSRTHPLAAAAMVVFLLSLAGIPATGGFVGKWWLFGAVIRADYAWLAVVAVLNSAVSLYYYARVIVAMYMTADQPPARLSIPGGLAAALGIAFLATIWIGLFPQRFIQFAQLAVLPLGGP